MPKTHDAFALRDVDENFFAAIVKPSPADGDDVAELERKRDLLLDQKARVYEFRRRITRHIGRFEKYHAALYEATKQLPDDEYARLVRPKMNRASILSKAYAECSLLCIDTEGTLDALFRITEKTIRQCFVKAMAARIRSARKAAGLTLQTVADHLFMTVGGYNQYEMAGRQPTPFMLARLAELYNCPVASLFPPNR